MKQSAARPFPEWYRIAILAIAGLIVALGLFSLYSAAAGWTYRFARCRRRASPISSHGRVILYFAVVLLVAPLLAAAAFVLAWQERNPGAATFLTAVAVAILLLRTALGGLN